MYSDLLNNLKNFFSHKKQSSMENEIFEQPVIVQNLINKHIKDCEIVDIDLPENINSIALIASGSSYHAATIAANYLRTTVHIKAQSYYASELSLQPTIDTDNETLYIFISQSGETFDTNNTLDKIAKKTNKTLSVTNAPNSTLYKNTTYKILVDAGVEKAIASTKAVMAQLVCLLLISLKIMQSKQIQSNEIIKDLKNTPSVIKHVFENRKNIKKFAKKMTKYNNAAILASGVFYPLAKESALKIKETSYINTTAYPTGEFLHGHIAILNKKCAVLAIVNNLNADFTFSVISKIKKNYNTDTLIISPSFLFNKLKDNAIFVNSNSDIDFLFGALVVIQLLALETSFLLKRNIDNPIGLSKIVK